ncbi:MAG TPA: response regulator [Candidatus Omnitrophota bacterium]|nr:response regulator [Candidatus Omnitrophota bacterium]
MEGKVLMIDDDKEYTALMSLYLRKKAYEVVSASNGKDGIEKALAERPDIIILDVMMTALNEGIETALEIKRTDGIKHIPIVLVTGVSKEMSLPFKMEADRDILPAEIVLEKPISPEKLLKTIKDVLRRKLLS